MQAATLLRAVRISSSDSDNLSNSDWNGVGSEPNRRRSVSVEIARNALIIVGGRDLYHAHDDALTVDQEEIVGIQEALSDLNQIVVWERQRHVLADHVV